ncbi:hypothetical protein V5F32_17100 [Xanthobacter oligotrophicus]|uniref:Uncharacterized protein n=1 Tax=Xanthobacter oligotrophicus TaxID=2607286 RepID=A0ABW6ZYP7_9HYPH
MSTILRLLSSTLREAGARTPTDRFVQGGAHARLVRTGLGVAMEALA